MKHKLNIPRLVVASAAALLVGGAATAQMVSELATRTAPQVAAETFPANGAAYEVAAGNGFAKSVGETRQVQPAAAQVRSLALEAYRRDPGSARALALLALAESDNARRNALALAASRTNRRDLTLQGAVLEAHIATGDFDEVVETLDQILRVHPTYRTEFFPILGEALRDESAVPVFARLLDGSSPWHVYFFTNYVLGQPELLANVALLREGRDLAGPEFDRQLVDRLVQAGEGEAAARLYLQLSGGKRSAGNGLGWAAEFPPFDWQFTDESDFRAQVSRDGARLELFARPGKGGDIAQRVLPLPSAPFTLKLAQFAENADQAENVRVELRCPGEQQPFFVKQLANGENTLSVASAPACQQMLLVINARAFTGRPTLRTELSAITIASR